MAVIHINLPHLGTTFVGSTIKHVGELDERFEQSKVLPSVLALEKLLISAANGKTYDEYLKTIRESCYKEDFNFSELQKQLPLLVDVIKHGTPLVKTVTSIRTI